MLTGTERTSKALRYSRRGTCADSTRRARSRCVCSHSSCERRITGTLASRIARAAMISCSSRISWLTRGRSDARTWACNDHGCRVIRAVLPTDPCRWDLESWAALQRASITEISTPRRRQPWRPGEGEHESTPLGPPPHKSSRPGEVGAWGLSAGIRLQKLGECTRAGAQRPALVVDHVKMAADFHSLHR